MLTKNDIVSHMKQFWTDESKLKFTYENHPFLAMVPKDSDGGGDTLNIPLDLDDGAEGSPLFSTALAIAKANSTDGVGKRFVADWLVDFQLARVPNKLIRETRKTPELALMRATERNVKARAILSRRIARGLWRSGWGEKGKINQAAFNVKTLTLADPTDARHFHLFDQLQFGPDLDTSALRDSGDFVSVAAIDVDAGVITTDAPVDLATSITGIANGDFIFLRDARPSGAAPTRRLPLGVNAYVPDSAPGGTDSFLTVNRSVWVNRLAGLRFPSSGNASGAVQEIFINGLMQAAQHEAYVDKVFVSSDIYGDLLKALEGQVEKTNEKVGPVGFNGFEISIGYGMGSVKVFPDPDMPAKRAFGLTMNTWKLITCGELIQNDLQQGEARDVEDDSALEWRYVFHGQLACNNPGKNILIKFS